MWRVSDFLSPSPEATAKNPKPGIVKHQSSRIIGVTKLVLFLILIANIIILNNINIIEDNQE